VNTGDRVERRASGEVGVVVKQRDDGLYDVVFPSGAALVHADELRPLSAEPEALLASGQLGASVPYALRLQALYLRHAYRFDPLSGLSNARIEPSLHQIYIAHRVARKLQPRMILADEVGLGKTIEAGLILKELRARAQIQRVLVLCPASLQAQWQQELRSKFNEHFEIMDGAAVKYLGQRGANPWAKRDNVICSLPFASYPKRMEQIVEAEWDLVVFDEAHRVRRWRQSKTRVKTTQAYRLADELKELTSGLLLLTATPMQLHSFELFSLIELVEPGLFPTFESYEQRRRQLPQLNEAMKTLVSWRAMPQDQRPEAGRKLESTLQRVGIADPNLAHLDDDGDRSALMDRLVERHPLSNVMVRNRKAELGGFVRRDPHRVPVELSDEEAELYEDVTDYTRQGYNEAVATKNNAVGFLMVTYQKLMASSSHAVRASFQKRITKLRQQQKAARERQAQLTESALDELRDAAELSEARDEVEGAVLDMARLGIEIDRLEDLVTRLGRMRDSKADTLVAAADAIFENKPDEKILVFTQFIETQQFIAAALRANGYSVSLFNGSMSLDDKEEAVRVFRERGQVLVATESGGEGRNFQFCHILFNYDLPWNPMKVEQRIGRLDRIGQKRPILIYNLACAGTIEERVLDVLDQRIGLFEESVGSLDPILGDVETDIERLIMSQTAAFDAEFKVFEQDLEAKVLKAREAERTLADFALDRASFRRDEANALLARKPMANHRDLERFVSDALAFYGGMLTEHDQGGSAISLSPHLGARLRTRQSAVRGVFDPALALEHEDLPFLAFGHNLIDAIVDLPISFEPVTTGVRCDPETSGGPFVEVIYEIETEGAQPSGALIRHLVAADLTVRSERMAALPAPGEEAPSTKVPDWAEDALARSRAHFEEEFAVERRRLHGEAGVTRQEQLVRAERIFEYRRLRLQSMIDEAHAWILEKEAHGSDRDRRILPARKGRLAKDRDRLARLEAEFEEQARAIAAWVPGAAARVLAAGIVIGAPA